MVDEMKSNPGFLDRLIDRLDRLDPSSVQSYVLRLVKEKGFLETVFNTIREGVIVISRDLAIHYTNPAAGNLLGLPEDFSGQKISRFLRDIDWERLMSAEPEEWHRVSLQEIEVYYPIHRYLNFYLVPCKSEEDDRDFPLATIILHDVTDRHKDTEATIETQRIRAITMLAAGVAHEIGNPLNSLNIQLQLLQRHLRRLDDQQVVREGNELLEVATQEVKRLDTIINNFLRAIRPTPPNMKRIRLDKVLADSLEFMRNEIEDRNILVEASWPDDLPLVMGDADQLKQAFFNLMKNALQAMPDGGLLRVGCQTREHMLELRFADTGKGISGSDLSHIMEPYYTRRVEGTGLGLFIVERVIRSHGGELGIESEEGRGTVFTIRLPLHDRRIHLLQAPMEDETEAATAAELETE
jgi:signal transduction histidine kinase